MVLAVGAAGWLGYETHQPFRHTVLAVIRCSRIAGGCKAFLDKSGILTTASLGAAIPAAVDYKVMMMRDYKTEEELEQAWSECHERAAKRVLKALLANGGS